MNFVASNRTKLLPNKIIIMINGGGIPSKRPDETHHTAGAINCQPQNPKRQTEISGSSNFNVNNYGFQ